MTAGLKTFTSREEDDYRAEDTKKGEEEDYRAEDTKKAEEDDYRAEDTKKGEEDDYRAEDTKRTRNGKTNEDIREKEKKSVIFSSYFLFRPPPPTPHKSIIFSFCFVCSDSLFLG